LRVVETNRGIHNQISWRAYSVSRREIRAYEEVLFIYIVPYFLLRSPFESRKFYNLNYCIFSACSVKHVYFRRFAYRASQYVYLSN